MSLSKFEQEFPFLSKTYSKFNSSSSKLFQKRSHLQGTLNPIFHKQYNEFIPFKQERDQLGRIIYPKKEMQSCEPLRQTHTYISKNRINKNPHTKSTEVMFQKSLQNTFNRKHENKFMGKKNTTSGFKSTQFTSQQMIPEDYKTNLQESGPIQILGSQQKEKINLKMNEYMKELVTDGVRKTSWVSSREQYDKVQKIYKQQFRDNEKLNKIINFKGLPAKVQRALKRNQSSFQAIFLRTKRIGILEKQEYPQLSVHTYFPQWNQIDKIPRLHKFSKFIKRYQKVRTYKHQINIQKAYDSCYRKRVLSLPQFYRMSGRSQFKKEKKINSEQLRIKMEAREKQIKKDRRREMLKNLGVIKIDKPKGQKKETYLEKYKQSQLKQLKDTENLHNKKFIKQENKKLLKKFHLQSKLLKNFF